MTYKKIIILIIVILVSFFIGQWFNQKNHTCQLIDTSYYDSVILSKDKVINSLHLQNKIDDDSLVAMKERLKKPSEFDFRKFKNQKNEVLNANDSTIYVILSRIHQDYRQYREKYGKDSL